MFYPMDQTHISDKERFQDYVQKKIQRHTIESNLTVAWRNDSKNNTYLEVQFTSLPKANYKMVQIFRLDPIATCPPGIILRTRG